MLKLLFLALVVIVAYRLFTGGPAAAARAARARRRAASEDMVRCAYCGTHVPRSESIYGEGGSFCSQEHARLSN